MTTTKVKGAALVLGGVVLMLALAGGMFLTLHDDPGSAKNSAIVRRVEAAGSGNVDRHPRLIAPFFDTHVDLARQLGPECNAAVVPANVNWRATTEGMVCGQAEVVVHHGAGYRDPELQREINERSVQ